tara:strand:+ start:7066 stop:7350 length:285 start_codon:yes stop_codon:yes gene_type:complete
MIIQALIAGLARKEVAKIIFKMVSKQFKMQKLLKYMEKPNDCDIRVDKLEEEVKKLKELSHPQQDFVCTTCNTIASRVEEVDDFSSKLKQIKEK